MMHCFHENHRITALGNVFCRDCGIPKVRNPPEGSFFEEHRSWPSVVRFPRILVCGGREYQDRLFVWSVLDFLYNTKQSVGIVICGMNRKGADRFASTWAIARGVALDPHPITSEDWLKYKRGCGNARNQRMLQRGQPDCGIAFPGGGGTLNMCQLMGRALISVWEPTKGPLP
jgi:hypothetical protein